MPRRPASGSSPLARGLPGYVELFARGGGIIPARAGFTPPWTSPSTSTTDHPRSRGVYENCTFEGVLDAGSSPLARGLPAKPAEIMPGIRIIPARAGFTSAHNSGTDA